MRVATGLFLMAAMLLTAKMTSGQESEPARMLPRLKVSEDQRHLATEDGRPFFYLGDTAWELFHRLNREEVDLYLQDRARKHFTVIQAVALAELEGLQTGNAYGHLPLVENDPARPLVQEGEQNDYWDHVDYIVNRAESLGLYIGLLPTWGDKWNKKWGVGPEIFKAENARAYGRFLGERYKNKPIIWILGGDRNPENEQHLAIHRAMAEGIREAVGDTQLITYHPQGGSHSSQWFHNDSWLDFNSFQSGHGEPDKANYEMTLADYHREPVKPVIDAEPRYEDHPINWNPQNGWFMDFDVRQAAWWSMLSGAAGHTYGNHNIWQMWQPGRQPVSSARTPWREALNHIGATQVGYMRQLFESRPWQLLQPQQDLIGDSGVGPAHQRAALAKDGSFAVVYTPHGDPIDIDLTRFSGSEVIAYWFDPRNGKPIEIGKLPTKDRHTLTPPRRGRGNDWVLVVDDAARGFGAPGYRP